MSDLATTIHNIPPASVARTIRGRSQWAAYGRLSEAGGKWVNVREIAACTYGADFTVSEYHAVKATVSRLQAKGFPIEKRSERVGQSAVSVYYRLSLLWQREQDGVQP